MYANFEGIKDSMHSARSEALKEIGGIVKHNLGSLLRTSAKVAAGSVIAMELVGNKVADATTLHQLPQTGGADTVILGSAMAMTFIVLDFKGWLQRRRGTDGDSGIYA